MGLHAFTEYLKYKWRAKGRHGVHSPFIYDLTEHVLLDKGGIAREYIVEYPSLALRYENLISRVAAYYKYKTILRLPLAQGAVLPARADLVLLNEAAPTEWVGLLDEYHPLLHNESAVIAPFIHASPAHTQAWRKLCADPKVRTSIDLYGTGLLFFKQEFKEKQAFVLKY